MCIHTYIIDIHIYICPFHPTLFCPVRISGIKSGDFQGQWNENIYQLFLSASHFTATAAAALAAAPTASALAAAPARKTAPGQENTMARKDGKAPKLRPKSP